MIEADAVFQLAPHDHVFLGQGHEKAERCGNRCNADSNVKWTPYLGLWIAEVKV